MEAASHRRCVHIVDIKVDLGDVGCARWESCAVGAEVFGAHRAYDDVDDQAGACRRGFECRQGGYGK